MNPPIPGCLSPNATEHAPLKHHQAKVLDATPAVALFGEMKSVLGIEDHRATLPRPA
jgi:hypothetical protein